jgi:molybdopterin synthase sulfur carrier subunit
MKITLRLTNALSRLNSGHKDAEISCEQTCDMNDLIHLLENRMPGITSVLLSHDLTIADSINIYRNGENIRYLDGLKTSLKDLDHISIIPAAAAG